jgi:hypothetical protein
LDLPASNQQAIPVSTRSKNDKLAEKFVSNNIKCYV